MWNSLRVRLASILLGLAIGPLILAGAILSQRTLAAEEKQALAFQNQVSKNSAAEVEALFNGVVNNLTTLGGGITGLREPDRAQQLSLLLSALSSGNNQDAYDALTLLDDQGNEILRLSRQEIVPREQLVSHKTSEDYLQPKANRGPYFSTVNLDEKNGQMYITIAIPLYLPRSVQLSNVLIARVRFGIISSVLSNATIGEGQTIYVTDSKGSVLAHQERLVNLQNTVISLPTATSIQTGLDGTKSVIAYSEVKLGAQVFRVVAEKPTSLALSLANTTITTLGIIILAALISAILIGLIAIQQIVRPIENLAVIAQKVAAGDLSQKVSVHRNDEIGTLASTFNSMTAQLGNLIASLENRVKERTLDLERANAVSENRARQFEAITRISHTINSAQNLLELLPRISEVVSEQFGFYHVGIFLTDASNRYATLVAANSSGGKKMLARSHQLRVGEQGIVGYVTGSGEPRMALDVGIDSVYFNNPNLPETHSEVALPLKIAGSVIGALDVQSTERNAFTKDDVEVLSTLADQISLAIQNARLFDQTQKALAESEALTRQNFSDTWSRLPEKQNLKGYRYSASGSAPLFEIGNSGDQNTKAVSQRQEISVPILLRGESIGTLSVQIPRSERISSDQVDLIKAVAERVALSAENARLFEETSTRATRERLVSDITTRIRSTNDPQEMIQTAVEELKRVLGATRIEIVPQKIALPPDK